MCAEICEDVMISGFSCNRPVTVANTAIAMSYEDFEAIFGYRTKNLL